MSVLIITGMYQSYDKDGAQVMTMFFVCNYYVISLQILWRLSRGELKQVTECVMNVNQDLKDGVIKNLDQSSQNISGIESLSKIEDCHVDGQNILLINKTLAENQETEEKLTENNESINSEKERMQNVNEKFEKEEN